MHSLPPPSVRPDAGDPRDGPPSSQEGGAESPSPASARDILVVDDNAANLLAIEAALADLGLGLIAAHSGREALATLLERDVALILLDVQMPAMDGFETAAAIRARERSRRVPIIFVTAHGDDEATMLRGYRMGAVDFLYKPIHPDVLRAKTSVFVELARTTDELRAAQGREYRRVLIDERRRWEAETIRREIAHQRRIADELERVNAQLAEADRKKDEFLAMLAHELRNPLAPIRTSLELIATAPDRPVAPRIRAILERQVDHLTRLVDDLLDVARITAGKIELRREPVRLDDVVAHAIVTSQPMIDDRQHRLQVAAPPAPVGVVGDPVRLAQAIANLLNNAARYTPRGGRIELTWGEDGGQVFVRVTDNGRGIPAELTASIFDMFVQQRADGDAGGLGLGLTLVRRLVELHGGQVGAASPGVGRGSTFEIRLPASPAAATAGAGVAPPAPAPVRRTLRAVVVDDHQDLRELLADLLASWGHEVATASDGPSGLAMIRECRPDVALLDIGLPGMDGYAVARALRAELGSATIRLVAMTGFGQQADRERALAAGFDLHIAKPATADALRNALDVSGPR
jgi:two-component system, sensor histidine kinase